MANSNYKQLFAQAIEQASKGGDPVQQQLEAEIQKPAQRNLAPTMALIDNLTGSNFAQSMPKQETQKEKLAQLLALKQQQQGMKMDGLGKLAQMQGQDEERSVARAFQEKMFGLKLAQAQHKAMQGPKIGSEDKKALGFTSTLLRDLQKYKEAVKQGGFRPTMWADAVGNTPLMALRQRLVENYGRLQSGGAISGDEEKRFGALFGSWQDDPAVLQQKLADMEAEIAGKDSLYGGQGPAARSPSTGSTDDAEAFAWAAANPNDPRSAQILQMMGK